MRKLRKFIREPYGMVPGHRPDRLRQDDDALRLPLGDPELRGQDHHHRGTRSSTSCGGSPQIPVNEKKGLTFARGLRSILRHDPDKVMVGEIRDPETAQIAIQSALTGHLVFTTVHANNVVDVLGPLPQHERRPLQLRLGAQLRAGAAPGAQDLPALPAAGPGLPPGAGGERARSGDILQLHLPRRPGLHRMQWHRIPWPRGRLRAAGPVGPHPRADSWTAGRPPRSSARRKKKG